MTSKSIFAILVLLFRTNTEKNHLIPPREGWPLLIIETGVNGDSKSKNERGPSLVGSLGLSCRYKIFFSALATLVIPVQNICSSPYTFSIFLSPIAQQAGQATVLGCLSLSTYMSLIPRYCTSVYLDQLSLNEILQGCCVLVKYLCKRGNPYISCCTTNTILIVQNS